MCLCIAAAPICVGRQVPGSIHICMCVCVCVCVRQPGESHTHDYIYIYAYTHKIYVYVCICTYIRQLGEESVASGGAPAQKSRFSLSHSLSVSLSLCVCKWYVRACECACVGRMMKADTLQRTNCPFVVVCSRARARERALRKESV